MTELSRIKTVILQEKDNNLKYICKDNENLQINLVDVNNIDTILNLEVKIKGNAEVKINLSSLGSDKNKKNYNIRMNHLSSNSKSSCEIFCVAKSNSSIFSIIETKISNKAGGTNSAQRIKGIMLSDNATIGGEPNLIIDKNDVKAAHGLAIGKINTENLFYLMSKGISRKEAEKLVIFGFFNKALSHINEIKRKKIHSIIQSRIYE